MPTLGAGSGGFGGGVLSEPPTANRLLQKRSPTYLLPQIGPVNTAVGGERYLFRASGYWSLWSNANDTSGNGNNGAAVNGPLSFTMGSGATFNGTNQSITVPAAASLNFGDPQLTVAAWVNPTANGGTHSNAVAASRSGCNGTNINWQLYSFLRAADSGVNEPRFDVIKAGNVIVSVNGSSTLPLNQPSLLAGTYDGAHLILSVGGVQNGTPVAETAAMMTNNVPTTIGVEGGCPGNFAGTIGKLRVQRMALPLSVLAALSAAGPTSLAWNDDRYWTNDSFGFAPQLIVVARGDDLTAYDNDWRIPLRRMIGG